MTLDVLTSFSTLASANDMYTSGGSPDHQRSELLQQLAD